MEWTTDGAGNQVRTGSRDRVVGSIDSSKHVAIIRRFDESLRRKGEFKPSQGELRELVSAGYAIKYPDHTFALTDSGRAVLAEQRRSAHGGGK